MRATRPPTWLLCLCVLLWMGCGEFATAFVSQGYSCVGVQRVGEHGRVIDADTQAYTRSITHQKHLQASLRESLTTHTGCISNVEIMAYNQTTNSLVLECDVDSLDALEFTNSAVGPIVKRVRADCINAAPLTVEVGDRVSVLQSKVLGVPAWEQRNTREVLNALHTRLLLGGTARLRFSRPIERLAPWQMNQILVPVYSVISLRTPFTIDVQEQHGKTGLLVTASSHELIKPGAFIVGYNKLRSSGKLYSVESLANWKAFVDSYSAADGVRVRVKNFASLSQVAATGNTYFDTDIHTEADSIVDDFPLADVPISEKSANYVRRRNYGSEDAFQAVVEQIWRAQSPRELDAIVRPLLNTTRKDYATIGQPAFQNFLTSAMRKAHLMGYDRIATGYFELVYPRHFVPARSQWDLTSLIAENSSNSLTDLDSSFDSNSSPNQAQELLSKVKLNRWKAAYEGLRRRSPPPPDDYCCAAAVKSYGRNKNFQGALNVLARLDVWNSNPGPNTIAALLGTLAKADDKKWWKACEAVFSKVPEYMPFTLYHLTTMMTYHLNRQEHDKVFQLFRQIKDAELQPNEVSYNILVRAYMEMKEHDNAFKLIKRMAYQKIPVTTTTYNQILKAYVKQRNLKGMVEVLEAMGRYNIQLDGSSYGHLVEGFYNAKKWNNVISTYHTMLGSDVPLHPHVFGKVLAAYSEMRDAYGALNAYKGFVERGFHPHRSHFSAVMNACVRGGAPDLAEQLFPDMKRRGLEPDLINLYVLAKAKVWQTKFDDAHGIISDIRRTMERGQTPILERMYSSLITGLCANSHWTRAEAVLDECLSVLRPGAALTYCLATLPSFFPIEKSVLLDPSKLKEELLSQSKRGYGSSSTGVIPLISKEPTPVLRYMITSCERIFRRQPRIRDPLYRMILKRCVLERNAPLAQLVLGWRRQERIKVLDDKTHVEGVYCMELSARALVRSALLPDPLAEDGDVSINWDAILASPSVRVSIDTHGNPQLLLPKDDDLTQDADIDIPLQMEVDFGSDVIHANTNGYDIQSDEPHRKQNDRQRHTKQKFKEKSRVSTHTQGNLDLRRDVEDLRRFYQSQAS